jgi:hypothetical protein
VFGVVACASATSYAPKYTAAAATRIEKTLMLPPGNLQHTLPGHHSPLRLEIAIGERLPVGVADDEAGRLCGSPATIH